MTGEEKTRFEGTCRFGEGAIFSPNGNFSARSVETRKAGTIPRCAACGSTACLTEARCGTARC